MPWCPSGVGAGRADRRESQQGGVGNADGTGSPAFNALELECAVLRFFLRVRILSVRSSWARGSAFEMAGGAASAGVAHLCAFCKSGAFPERFDSISNQNAFDRGRSVRMYTERYTVDNTVNTCYRGV